MLIKNNNYNSYKISSRKVQNINFCSATSSIQKGLNNINIKTAMDGYLGQTHILDKNNQKTLAKVFKETIKIKEDSIKTLESYYLKNDFDNKIGQIYIKIDKKFPDNKGYIFVTDLRNQSNKNTNSYSQIGTRLMQIANKRSIEEGFEGRIKLDSVPEAVEFYRKLGFKYDKTSQSTYDEFYRMFIPDENNNILKNKHSGL